MKKIVKLQKSKSACYNFTKKILVAQYLTRKMTKKMTRSRMNENPEN